MIEFLITVLTVACFYFWINWLCAKSQIHDIFKALKKQEKFNELVTDYIKRQLDDEKDLEGRDKVLKVLMEELRGENE